MNKKVLWNDPNCNPLEDLNRIIDEFTKNTGVRPVKKWEDMTEYERKMRWAEFRYNYAQGLYLMGFSAEQVVAEMKRLREIVLGKGDANV